MSRTRLGWTVLLVGVLLGAVAASSGSPAGHWSGAIDFSNFQLDVMVTLTSDGDAWSGTIDIPMQSADDLPLEDVTVSGEAISFALPSRLGRATFDGVLHAEGTIEGTFRQAGQERPFRLTRTGDGTAPPLTTSRVSDGETDSTDTTSTDPIAGFAAFVDSIRIAYRVPGCAVVIVRGQEVALDVGLGLRDVDAELPVTSHTLFAIGSATKPMTSFVLGTLVDDGLLSWDTPVSDYVPEFRLYDEVATWRMTPRDLVSHRSGLPRHDLVWYGAAYTREELFARLRYLEPCAGLREHFQYQNLMFLAAGVLAERVTGSSWETLVRERIFTPAGMRDANFSVIDAEASVDHARPHALSDGEIVEIPFRDISAVGPAGSINASSYDMARWLRMLIGGGEIDGRRLLSTAGLEDLFVPRTAIEQSAAEPDEPIAAYGSGWFVQPYRGHHRVHHGGNIDGFTSAVTLLPHQEIGIVVLANREATPLPNVVTRTAMDRLLGLEPRDWAGTGLAQLAAAMTLAEFSEEGAEPSRVDDTRPSHRLDAYASAYEHPGYGTIAIERDDDRLALSFHGMTATLEHWHYDVFRASSDERAIDGLLVTFATNAEGDVASLSTAMEPRLDPIVFARVRPSPLADPALVDALVGEYVLAGQVVTVGRRGDRALTLTVPGQPLYELEPYEDLEFRIKGITGYKVRFERDDNGPVTGLIFIQPNGVFTATKR